MKLNSAKERVPKGKRFFYGRRSAVGGRLRRRKRKTQGIKYHHKFALWCDMICKAAGKGHKNAAKRRERRGQGGALLSQTRTRPTAALPPECVRAPRRGIEIITSPGAQAPLAVGRTRRTEKPPGTRSGRNSERLLWRMKRGISTAAVRERENSASRSVSGERQRGN